MRCKICDTENEDFHYILRNSKVYRCKNCNLHYSNFLDEGFNSSGNNDDVLDDELRDYLRHQLQNNEERFTNQVKISSEYLKNIDSPKILDVGIGGGLFLSLMSKTENKPKCYGIELDVKRLQFAKEEYGLENIFSLPIQDEYWVNNHEGSFDLITLWDVIEHVNSPKEIFESANRLLNQGGVLIMDTPCRDTFYHRMGQFTYKISQGRYPTFLNIMYSNHPFGHKQILSKNDVNSLCKLSGHELVYMKVFHELSFPIKFYTEKMFNNRALSSLVNPTAEVMLKLLRIKNKMLFVAKKRQLTQGA